MKNLNFVAGMTRRFVSAKRLMVYIKNSKGGGTPENSVKDGFFFPLEKLLALFCFVLFCFSSKSCHSSTDGKINQPVSGYNTVLEYNIYIYIMYIYFSYFLAYNFSSNLYLVMVWNYIIAIKKFEIKVSF